MLRLPIRIGPKDPSFGDGIPGLVTRQVTTTSGNRRLPQPRSGRGHRLGHGARSAGDAQRPVAAFRTRMLDAGAGAHAWVLARACSGHAGRQPRRGDRVPRRARSAGLHPPRRSPGRCFQPAEPPSPRRVTSRGGQQHRIRDDGVARGPDGGRQVLRIVSADQHPRARAPSRTVRLARHVPDLPPGEPPLQFAPTLTVPYAVSPPQRTRRPSARRGVPAARAPRCRRHRPRRTHRLPAGLAA